MEENPVTEITGFGNSRLKRVARLNKKQSERKSEGMTVIEGIRELTRATENNFPVAELYFVPELLKKRHAENLYKKIAKEGLYKGEATKLFSCSAEVFAKISYRDNPDGILAIVPLVKRKLDELKLSKNPLLLVTEKIEKPGNLGALLRTADATGVEAVLVCDHSTDINNPNVIRAAMGTLFYLPVVEASSEDVLAFLKENEITVFATLPDAKKNYSSVDLSGPAAIVVGAEHDGLSEAFSEDRDGLVPVSIPMLGKNDSLNVSVAAAVLLYEAVRQRGV